MNENLAALEEAAQPYRLKGFRITQQNEMSMTLVKPREPLSVFTAVILLIVFWPVGVVYILSYRNEREKAAFFRLTSDGKIEVSGYTLSTLESEERARARSRKIWLIVILATLALFLLATLFLLFRRANAHVLRSHKVPYRVDALSRRTPV